METQQLSMAVEIRQSTTGYELTPARAEMRLHARSTRRIVTAAACALIVSTLLAMSAAGQAPQPDRVRIAVIGDYGDG